MNPTDLADLVDLVVSKKSYLYIESEQHQIMVMQRPLTVPLSLSNDQIMVCDDLATAHWDMTPTTWWGTKPLPAYGS